jgi:hypothetical protein
MESRIVRTIEVNGVSVYACMCVSVSVCVCICVCVCIYLCTCIDRAIPEYHVALQRCVEDPCRLADVRHARRPCAPRCPPRNSMPAV